MAASVGSPEARWWRRTGEEALVRLLGEVWDPIGVEGDVPGEYASYAPRLLGVLRDGEEAVVDRLLSFERGEMGLDGDRPRARRTAARLCAWWTATETDRSGAWRPPPSRAPRA
ncbi:hypothetical protein [Patulibacter sp. SYSU D01012]|uniref:hypothetical protein n=1 Tax=Patulibacter sp. SYSU D01012 TaxID=2817381 RepID=UPI001B3149D8|nr:hypothetical protein [Patulibacter sp. SYSU D01012]